jgi:hypothetical protein
VGRIAPIARILPQLDLTDELANLAIFIKKHEKDLRVWIVKA